MARKTDGDPPDAPKKVLLLETRNGELRRVSVPAHWRVTFGPMVPGIKEGGKAALRLYDGEDQKACFTDVNGFREEGIELLERVTAIKRNVVKRHTPSGDKDVVVEARVTEWRNPDRPEDYADRDEDFLEIEDLR